MKDWAGDSIKTYLVKSSNMGQTIVAVESAWKDADEDDVFVIELDADQALKFGLKLIKLAAQAKAETNE